MQPITLNPLTEKPSPLAIQPALGTQPYMQPNVLQCDIVNWHPFGDKNDSVVPAIVLKVGSRTVALHIFVENTRSLVYKDGVRHVDDPESKREEFRESGAWSHTKRTQEMIDLKRQLIEILGERAGAADE